MSDKQNLTEAWEGLTIRLSDIYIIEYRPLMPRCAGVTIPAGVRVNGNFYAGVTRSEYRQLRDAAIAWESSQRERRQETIEEGEHTDARVTQPSAAEEEVMCRPSHPRDWDPEAGDPPEHPRL